jgi:uncharacterized protein YkwD
MNLPAKVWGMFLIVGVYAVYFIVSVSYPQDLIPVQTRIFDLINVKRLAYNLPALTESQTLRIAAQNWSRELALGNYPSCTHSIYNSYAEIMAGDADFTAAIFPNYVPPTLAETFVDLWWDSAEHHAVMMSGFISQMGVGVSENHGYFVAVVDFQ